MIARDRSLHLLCLLGLVVVTVAATPNAPTRTLVAETSLRPSPGGTGLAGLLTTGTPVTVVEQRGDWVRVRLEGWIPAESLGDGAQHAATAVETPSPVTTPAGSVPTPSASVAAPTVREATAHTVEGMFRVKQGRFRTVRTAGESVWLLPATFPLPRDDGAGEASADRLAEIEVEAARLRREADRALMHIDNLGQANRKRNEFLRERDRLLRERLDLLASLHGRHEAAARQLAVASAVTDSKGWFSFPAVAPGKYTLYARLTHDDLDVEWIEELAVESSTVRVDLGEDGAHGLLPK